MTDMSEAPTITPLAAINDQTYRVIVKAYAADGSEVALPGTVALGLADATYGTLDGDKFTPAASASGATAIHATVGSLTAEMPLTVTSRAVRLEVSLGTWIDEALQAVENVVLETEQAVETAL